MHTLHDLFIHELKDLYDAENQITAAMPKFINETSSETLRRGFEKHLEQTKIHIERLEKIRDEMDFDLNGKKCSGMKGIIEEGEEILHEEASDNVKDAGLLAAIQKIEHYEIAGYGTAHAYARMMEHDTASRLLEETLREEKKNDKQLSEIAMQGLNKKALNGDK